MSGGSRGIVGRIWEKICDLLINSDAVKVTTDQMQFVDGKLRTTGEDASGGGGDLQPVIDELIELNSKVSLDDTLDLVSTEATQELIRQLLVLLNAKDYATETTQAGIKSTTDQLTFTGGDLNVNASLNTTGLSTEETSSNIDLNTNRTESLLVSLLEEQQKTNKYLRKIYNPE